MTMDVLLRRIVRRLNAAARNERERKTIEELAAELAKNCPTRGHCDCACCDGRANSCCCYCGELWPEYLEDDDE